MNPPYPQHREPGWFERSSWAMEAWRGAKERYLDAREQLGLPWRPDENAHRMDPDRAQAMADAALHHARAEYRHLIIGWYRKLCWPLKPGEVVPNEVATVQWEQWDLDDCDACDAVNL